MQVTIIILTQYFENYAIDAEGVLNEEKPYWKKKGGVEFSIEDDIDNFSYDLDLSEEVITEMLQEQSNGYCRYEYISHTIRWQEPTKLEGFPERLKAKFESIIHV